MKKSEKLINSITEFQLENNLRVGVVEDSTLSQVEMSIIVKAGLLEPDNISLDGAISSSLVALVMAKAFNYTSVGKLDKNLYAEGALLDVDVTNSNTIFKLTTSNKIYDYITKFLNYFSRFQVTKKSLDLAKKEAIFYIEKKLRDESFVNSLKVANLMFDDFSQIEIVNSYKKKIQAVNITTLRKFFSRYYTSEYMKFFIVGNVDVDLVKSSLEKSSLNSCQEKPTVKNYSDSEDYSKIKKDFYQENVRKPFSKLILSFKFPKRQDLYQQYGDDLFSLYQFITYAAYSEKSPYISKAIKRGLVTEICDYRVLEINEKIMLTGSIVTFEPDRLMRYISDPKSIAKSPSRGRFLNIKRKLISEVKENSHNGKFLLDIFVMSSSNNIGVSEFLSNIEKLSYRKIKELLLDLQKYPRSIYIERGSNDRN